MNHEAIIANFIGKQPEKAQFLLEKLRLLISSVSSEIEETGKYGGPFYVYKGYLCYLAIDKSKKVYIGMCRGFMMSDSHHLFHQPFDTAEIRKIYIDEITPSISEKIKDYVLESMLINDDLKKNKPGHRKNFA